MKPSLKFFEESENHRYDFNLSNLVKQLGAVHGGIQQLCKPILDYFGITYFKLHRVYPNNSFVILSTHPHWIEYYFSNHYFETTDTDCHERLSKFDYVLWDQWPEEDESVWNIIHEANSFKITNAISIVLKFPDSVNVFSFGAPTKHEGIYNKYLVNMSVLEKFCYYFLSKAHNLITEANQLKSQLPKIDFTCKEDIKDSQKFELLDFFNLNTLSFCIDNKTIWLNEKETKIIICCLQGMSAKCIANKYDLSSRTVEWHIENMKKKLDCHTKSQLCLKVSKDPMISYMVKSNA
jgi:DNA-binding CsgD family transcriptional regulator